MKTNQAVQVFKALADPTRLGMVRSLAECQTHQKACGDLSAKSELSQPAMSHHFGKLVTAGVVVESKAGTRKLYKLNNELLASIGLDINKL